MALGLAKAGISVVRENNRLGIPTTAGLRRGTAQAARADTGGKRVGRCRALVRAGAGTATVGGQALADVTPFAKISPDDWYTGTADGTVPLGCLVSGALPDRPLIPGAHVSVEEAPRRER